MEGLDGMARQNARCREKPFAAARAVLYLPAMPIIGDLTEYYREEGIELCAGLAPNHAEGLPWAPFTWFCRDGKSVTGNLGIAVQEVYFFEHVLAAYKPKRALIIGNSMGWSTLALGLLMPQGKVAALDMAPDQAMRDGLALTNRVAKLDGLHTNEQVVLDYQAVRAKAAPNAVYLFHDVSLFDLHAGIAEIGRLSGQTPRLLLGTPSGMVILFDAKLHPELARAVAAFAPPDSALQVVRNAAWDRRHRPLARWRRSFNKRMARLRPGA